MRIRIYVDGFNLFYGRLKNTKNKNLNLELGKLRWLNLQKLIEECLSPECLGNIVKINFYTADIIARYDGDKSPQRQREYFKALMTVDNLEIVKGRYANTNVTMPLYPIEKVNGSDGRTSIKMATVAKTEEKRSDVNLASHLVRDACLDKFDMAIIVSNDSDLLEPIKIVRDMKKKFLILSPSSRFCHDFTTNFSLKSMRKIQQKHIVASQFPDEIKDVTGEIKATRPDKWK